MTFFSRPVLDDIQFKQLNDSVLTLSGQTRIASVSGLTLSDGAGGNIVISASGASSPDMIGSVLTFNGNSISLYPASPTGETMMYVGSSPASITLGGIVSGTTLTGKTVSCIIEELLVPTINPTLTNPSSTFTLSPSTIYYHVGCSASIVGNSAFNRGCICPQYTSLSDKRSGLPISYDYINFTGGSVSVASNLLSDSYVFPARVVQYGANTVCGRVYYSGGTQPKDSKGADYLTALSSGCTSGITRSICGIYPYYYGTSSTSPTINQTLINSATGCVSVSTSNVLVKFNTSTGKYLWVGIPASSTSKTRWCTSNSTSNCGAIGGTGNLFGSETQCTINSNPAGCWTGINYKFYVTNYATCTCADGSYYSISLLNS